jgi:hypothetical protein
LWHKAFKNSRYTEGYACEFLKTFYQKHLSTREAFIHKNRSTQVKFLKITNYKIQITNKKIIKSFCGGSREKKEAEKIRR